MTPKTQAQMAIPTKPCTNGSKSCRAGLELRCGADPAVVEVDSEGRYRSAPFTSATAASKVRSAALDGRGKAGRVPALWDGHAAERIAAAIAAWAQGHDGRA